MTEKNMTHTFFAKTENREHVFRYGINLLWCNRALNSTQPFLKEDSEEKERAILATSIEWAKINPDATITFWYDGHFTTNEAVQNTERLLLKMKTEANIPRVIIRDIHEISLVKNNPDIFSDQIPLYFRIDLLKFILLVHDAEQERQDYSIFTDVDITPIPKEMIFSLDILKLLNRNRLLMMFAGSRKENKWLQVNCHNQTMLNSLKMFINLCMLREINMMNKLGKKYLPGTTQAVFAAIDKVLPKMCHYFEHGGDLMMIDDEEQNEAYHLESHGYEPWGLETSPSGNDQSEHALQGSSRVQMVCCARKDLSYLHSGSHTDRDLQDRPPANGQDYQCSLLPIEIDKAPTPRF